MERTGSHKAWLESCGLAADATTAHICYGGTTLEVPVDLVLAVRDGLEQLRDNYSGLFGRAAVMSRPNEIDPPSDALRRLSLKEHGSLTDSETGEWLPIARQIVCALTSINQSGGRLVVDFAANPFVVQTPTT